MNRSCPLLSIVVPVFREERVLPAFFARMTVAIDAWKNQIAAEVILVNDGSTDRSLDVIMERAGSGARYRVIDLSRNFGHQVAITAGTDAARGDAVVVIDADLQDPPEVIGEMIERWRAGFQVVYGVRRRRAGESVFKKFSAAVFYRILSKLSDTKIPADTGDFRLMDRVVVDALHELREENRYIRGLVSWVGFKQCPVLYDRDARFAGETKFNLRRMVRFAWDGVSGFSDRPLRFSGYLGICVTFGALLYIIWILIGRMLHPETVIQGWTSVIVIVLFLGGVQLTSIGILGEYIARIFRQTKGRPLYFVARRVNFDEPAMSKGPDA